MRRNTHVFAFLTYRSQPQRQRPTINFLYPFLDLLSHAAAVTLMLMVHVHVHLRPFSTTFRVFCKPRPTFSSCVLSSHLRISSPTQGHTSHGADSISWEIQVARKDRVWIVSYVWSNCIAPSQFTHRLDTQMKYISHSTFYQETTSSLNSSELKKWFTP